MWEGSAAAPQAEQARGGPRAAPQRGARSAETGPPCDRRRSIGMGGEQPPVEGGDRIPTVLEPHLDRGTDFSGKIQRLVEASTDMP